MTLRYKLCNARNQDITVLDLANVIFADYVYENTNFDWIDKWWPKLVYRGVFIAMTDHHSIFELGTKLMSMRDAKLVNHLVWKNEWGNYPKDRFHQSFDNIVIVSKGLHCNFYGDKIQIPKATAKTKLNPSGRQTKTATAFIDDICLTTTSCERVRMPDGKLIPWQKPLKLMQRILAPFVDPDDLLLDLFMGSGTAGVWALSNGVNYIGIESDLVVFSVAEKRIAPIVKQYGAREML